MKLGYKAHNLVDDRLRGAIVRMREVSFGEWRDQDYTVDGMADL